MIYPDTLNQTELLEKKLEQTIIDRHSIICENIYLYDAHLHGKNLVLLYDEVLTNSETCLIDNQLITYSIIKRAYFPEISYHICYKI